VEGVSTGVDDAEMTRPDPDAIGRAVAAAFRFDPSVRADADHLSAVLHDIEPSVRPAQLRAVVAAVHGDLAGMLAQHPTESDDAIATRFATVRGDFDPAQGVEVVRVFRQTTAGLTLPPPPGGSSDEGREQPFAAPTAMPPAPPTAAPPAAPTAAPSGAQTGPFAQMAGDATQLRPEPDLPIQPTRPNQPPKRSRRLVWIAAVVILVAAVAVVLVLNGGASKKPLVASTGTGASGHTTSSAVSGTSSAGRVSSSAVPPPKPFTSAVLYDNFARPFFALGDCYIPTDDPQHHFPFVLRDKELVNCRTPAGTVGANLWCKNTLAQLEAERRHYLHVAAPGSMKVVPGKPAGWTAPADGVQRSYRRGGLPGEPARVYWDSPKLLCGAELQASNESPAQLVAFFHHGR
jgi:hypothetical protein